MKGGKRVSRQNQTPNKDIPVEVRNEEKHTEKRSGGDPEYGDGSDPENGGGSDPENGGGNDPADPSDDQENDQECAFCLLTPCVTRHPHYFLGPGQQPCDNNSGIRHDKYSKYWKVIGNLGGWNDPQYLVRKVQIGGGGQCVVVHRREIMPECVLKQVRGLYPNPAGRPYMGHKWE